MALPLSLTLSCFPLSLSLVLCIPPWFPGRRHYVCFSWFFPFNEHKLFWTFGAHLANLSEHWKTMKINENNENCFGPAPGGGPLQWAWETCDMIRKSFADISLEISLAIQIMSILHKLMMLHDTHTHTQPSTPRVLIDGEKYWQGVVDRRDTL